MNGKDIIRGIGIVAMLALLSPSSSFAGDTWGFIGAALEGLNKGLRNAQDMEIGQQQIELQKQQMELQQIEIERQRIELERIRTQSPSPDPQQEQMIRAERSRQWTNYTKNPNGNSFYYDRTSVSLDGQYATFREWIEHSPQGGGAANLKNTWRTCTINCHDNLFRLSNFLIVDNNGRILRHDDMDWKALPAGSAFALLANRIRTNSPNVQQGLSTESPSPSAEQEQMIRAERSKHWTKYAKDKKGNSFYYDATSVIHGVQYATVREWIEFSPEGSGTENLKDGWRTSSMNCRDNLIRFNFTLMVYNTGQIKQSLIETEWKAMPAGSVFSLLSNKVCTNKGERVSPEVKNMENALTSVSKDIRGKYALKTFKVEDAKGLVLTEKDVTLLGTLEIRDKSFKREISFANQSEVTAGTYSLAFDTPTSGRARLQTEKGTLLDVQFEIFGGDQLTFRWKQTREGQTREEWDNWVKISN